MKMMMEENLKEKKKLPGTLRTDPSVMNGSDEILWFPLCKKKKERKKKKKEEKTN